MAGHDSRVDFGRQQDIHALLQGAAGLISGFDWGNQKDGCAGKPPQPFAEEVPATQIPRRVDEDSTVNTQIWWTALKIELLGRHQIGVIL